MDIGEIEQLADRLDRFAEAIDRTGLRARGLTEGEWRGGAAEAFEDRVRLHQTDLRTLAARVHDAARQVRAVGESARRRLDGVAGDLPGSGGWW